MIKVSQEELDQLEENYPGFKETLYRYEKKRIPHCIHCQSEDTSLVCVGVIGRTINLAAVSSKVHLRANNKPGKYYCNTCKKYFK